jgi:DNA-binding GntR family transcriptional regulator
VLAQLLPDDRKIEWAPTLDDAEALLVGTLSKPAAAVQLPQNMPEDKLGQARTVFEEMKQQYAAGNFARYGELLQELGKVLSRP